MVQEYRDSEQADYYLFGIRAYETFNAKGRFITYQDKSVEYQSLETDIRTFLNNTYNVQTILIVLLFQIVIQKKYLTTYSKLLKQNKRRFRSYSYKT